MSDLLMPSATPSSQGVDAAGLLRFLDAAAGAGVDLHSLAVARHGSVLAAGWWAPYAADRPCLGYSLSKSFTATAVGFLVQEGVLGLDDVLVDRLPSVGRAQVDERWRRVRLRHALSMTLGHTDDAWPAAEAKVMTARPEDMGDALLEAILANPPDQEPGSVFAYNQVATYLVSRIVQEVTGEPLSVVLRRRLGDPLGLPPIPWQTDGSGHELGFTGAHLTTGSILALGQLYLDGGRWAGRQLLPQHWVDHAVRSHVGNAGPGTKADWSLGYGLSFWQSQHGYRGDGAFGQYALVLPAQDAVVAITSEVADMQEVLDLVWEHLLPAFDGGQPGDLADEALAERLRGVGLRPSASTAPPPATPVELGRSDDSDLPERFGPIKVSASEDGWVLTLNEAGRPSVVPCGDGSWGESRLPVGPVGSLAVAGSGGWLDDGCFEAQLVFVETPHRLLLRIDPQAGTARVTWRQVPLSGPDPAWLVAHPAAGAVGLG